GVQREYYLQSDARRRAYGLEPLPGMASRDDQEQLKRNMYSADADFVPFAITVSTSADQTALAPGDLEREWTQGDRKFFRYRLAKPDTNFWAVVTGRYAVARDKWNDVELAVYYHPKHSTNVPRMLEGMKQALVYYTANFGPFPHRQLRIAELPRYAEGAQSFATMIAYSESSGFILDVRESVFDLVWYVTAHEVAHQWWGHQIFPANVEGAQFLSESLPEHSSLIGVGHRYSLHKMRQFLKRNLESYLHVRAKTSDEKPLARGPKNQNHVHYMKGSLALYALKDTIGEAALNRALARFLRDHAFKSDPLSDDTRCVGAAARRGRTGTRSADHRPVRQDHAVGSARCGLGSERNIRRQVARAHRCARQEARRRGRRTGDRGLARPADRHRIVCRRSGQG